MPSQNLVRTVALVAAASGALLPGPRPEGQGSPAATPAAAPESGSDFLFECAGELRVEHFVLEGDSPAAEEPEVPAPQLGLAILRSVSGAGGVQLECEVLFPQHDSRVLHVERRRGDLRAALQQTPGVGADEFWLVWRELRPGAGRTLSLSPVFEQERLRVTEWGGRRCRRRALDPAAGALLPLELAERARHADLEPGPLHVFDPLAGEFRAARASITEEGATRGTARTAHVAELAVALGAAAARAGTPPTSFTERVYEVHLGDGSLLASYRFRQDDLVSFRAQNGGWTARRVPRTEFELIRRRQEAEADSP